MHTSPPTPVDDREPSHPDVANVEPWLRDATALAERAAAMVSALQKEVWPQSQRQDIDELAETWEDLAAYFRSLSGKQVHQA
jgi:hypothetical protein